MAKVYIRGADYKLYRNSNTFASPTWNEVKGVGNIDVASNPEDVPVPERGMDTGHLQGEDDPAITFELFEDTGDTHNVALVTAMYSGALIEIAVARGNIATLGVKYWRLEACLKGVSLGAGRGDPATYDVEAGRHANSDNPMSTATV